MCCLNLIENLLLPVQIFRVLQVVQFKSLGQLHFNLTELKGTYNNGRIKSKSIPGYSFSRFYFSKFFMERNRLLSILSDYSAVAARLIHMMQANLSFYSFWTTNMN